MFVLATSDAESVLAVGAAILFAGAYTALAAFAPYYREKTGYKERMETRALILALVGSLVALAGATLDCTSSVNVGSVALAVAGLYVVLIVLPVVLRRFFPGDD